ncbi:hypothetical protein JCM10296v2_001373 [Rhodotorula toruloides]
MVIIAKRSRPGEAIYSLRPSPLLLRFSSRLRRQTRFKTQGNPAFAAQNWNKAIDCWTKAIKKEKDAVALASLYSNRSAAYLKVSKYDAALRDAEQAVLKRPTWSKAKARMAEVYARQQIFDLAKSSYERAIELAEDDATHERY